MDYDVEISETWSEHNSAKPHNRNVNLCQKALVCSFVLLPLWYFCFNLYGSIQFFVLISILIDFGC